MNGGYECCPRSSYRSSPIARMESYFNFCKILGVPIHVNCNNKNSDCLALLTPSCPLIDRFVANGKSCPLVCTEAPATGTT